MNNPNYERESANAVLDLLSLAGDQESSAKGRGGVRPASTHQMRAIHALAQCEGMTVDGLPVEADLAEDFHGQTAELRLPSNYTCHSQAASSVGRLVANQFANSGQGDRVRFYPVFSTLYGKSPVFMRLPGQPDRETG